jgi:hypothetical protein
MIDKSLLPPPAFHRAVVRLSCSACGAEANASCNCGAIYTPKAFERAAEAVAAHPEKSNRALAKETGTSEATMRRARDATASMTQLDEPRTGLDGKRRKLPSYIPDPPPLIRDELIEQAIELVRQMTPAERVEFIRLVGRV